MTRKMTNNVKHIPLLVVAGITGQSIERVERKLIMSAKNANGIVPVQTAINYAISLAPEYGKPKRVVSMKLPAHCILALRNIGKTEEATYRAIGKFIADECRGTDLLFQCQPTKTLRAMVQKKLRTFCPFAWMSLKFIAYSCDVNASDVFSWGAYLWLENCSQKEK